MPLINIHISTHDAFDELSLAITINGLPLGFVQNQTLLQQILFEYPTPTAPSIIWDSSASASTASNDTDMNDVDDSDVDHVCDADDEDESDDEDQLNQNTLDGNQGSPAAAHVEAALETNNDDGDSYSSDDGTVSASSVEIICLERSPNNPLPPPTILVKPTKIYREDVDGTIILTSDDSDVADLRAEQKRQVNELRRIGVLPTIRKNMRYLKKSKKWIPEYYY
ncbi:hypothetical protein MBANPS3_012581 [Mucor bainieri]